MIRGNSLRRNRLAKNLTLEEVYIKSRRQLTPSRLSRLERDITIPTENDKRILADILEVPAEKLFSQEK